jgi:argininosuccinate synthase
LREALDAFVNQTQKEVSGAVTLSLYKGNIGYVGRVSQFSQYQTDLASFTMGDGYDQKDAAGFIRILALPARARAMTRTQAPAQAAPVSRVGAQGGTQ